MRKVSKFTLVGGAAVIVALLGAIAGILDRGTLAVAAGNVALALIAGLVVLADRRRRRQALRERKAVGSSLGQLHRQSERVEQQVDMVQRRVIAALETARLEEIDRARSSASTR